MLRHVTRDIFIIGTVLIGLLASGCDVDDDSGTDSLDVLDALTGEQLEALAASGLLHCEGAVVSAVVPPAGVPSVIPCTASQFTAAFPVGSIHSYECDGNVCPAQPGTPFLSRCDTSGVAARCSVTLTNITACQ